MANRSYARQFHTHSGWTFNRTQAGTVVVEAPNGAAHEMSPETWASVVASVSNAGETSAAYQEALEFHTEHFHAHLKGK